jgi:hypothetical protein
MNELFHLFARRRRQETIAARDATDRALSERSERRNFRTRHLHMQSAAGKRILLSEHAAAHHAFLEGRYSE